MKILTVTPIIILLLAAATAQDTSSSASTSSSSKEGLPLDNSHDYACQSLAADTPTTFNMILHRNGEPDACGEALSSPISFATAIHKLSLCDKDAFDKYDVEAILTTLLLDQLSPSDSCGSTDNATAVPGLSGYCDMGPDRTVIQEDHESLVRTPSGSLPCRFFTREGLRIASIQQLTDYYRSSSRGGNSNSQECLLEEESCAKNASTTTPSIHLYAVPSGRVFMFAPSFIGERFAVTHADTPGELPIVLETISLSPRVFEIHNFYSPTEADELVEKALNETSETMGLHRSTTGSVGAVINSKRTSENAWDQNGKTALRLKKRCMETLGFDEYNELLTDGLQILRYKNNQAYNSHPDYLSDAPEHWYDYDSSRKGGNRFATILLYMSDIGT
jgi:hypothetical protein